VRNFPTPHCHPMSFDSGSTPESFAKREVELGTGALTVTDHGSMAACRKVYDLAKKNNLAPILGLEAYFRDDKCPILTKKGYDPASYLKYCHLTIHARDEQAYFFLGEKLSRAPTETHGSEAKPIFTWTDLEEIGAQNVTMTSGCLAGMVQRHILDHSNLDVAKAYYEKLRSVVRPGNFYVEAFPHKCDKNWVAGVFFDFEDGTKQKYWASKKLKFRFAGEIEAKEAAKRYGTPKWTDGDELLAVRNYRSWTDLPPKKIVGCAHIEDFISNECQPWCPDGDVQKGANKVVMALARKYGDKILISDDSHYATPEEKIVQDIRLQQNGSWRFYGTYNRQDSKQAFEYFSQELGISLEGFEGLVENNLEWADGFKDFKFNSKVSLPTSFYPKDTLAHTYELIKKHGRMDWNAPVYVNRLNAEIELLHRNQTIDLLPYFFIGEDVCSFYERQGMLTGPGRGSAAGLLLAYLLGITHVDPLKFGLSMERFLTLDRIKSGKLPDIDQDLGTREPLVDGWLETVYELELEDGSTVNMRGDDMVVIDGKQMEVAAALAAGIDLVEVAEVRFENR